MNDLSRYSGGAPARLNRAELARVERTADLTVTKTCALAYASEEAMGRIAHLQLRQKLYEEIAPNGAESYAALVQIATTGALGLVAELGYRL